jgi:hypothetical protein
VLEKCTVDLYIALAECYDAWDQLDLVSARESLASLRKAIDVMADPSVKKGRETLERMFGRTSSKGRAPTSVEDDAHDPWLMIR